MWEAANKLKAIPEHVYIIIVGQSASLSFVKLTSLKLRKEDPSKTFIMSSPQRKAQIQCSAAPSALWKVFLCMCFCIPNKAFLQLLGVGESVKLAKKKVTSQLNTWKKDTNKYISKENIQMASKHLKRLVGKNQIDTTMSYNLHSNSSGIN